MAIWIALFRGINVGGKNKLPMKGLKHSLEKIACSNVDTYIQSGNVVFHSRTQNDIVLKKRIGEVVEKDFGITPRLILLTAAELRSAKDNNPFPKAESTPKTLHFFFLESEADQRNRAAVKTLAIKSERYELINRVFYLNAPEGFGRSKLAANVERILGVNATARNFSTIQQLTLMIENKQRE